MKSIITFCWRDTRGDASAIGMLLVSVIVCLGAVVGLSSVRDQIVQEFGDVGTALNCLTQAFDYEIEIDANGDGDLDDPQDQILSCSYRDTFELGDPAGAAPACIQIN